MSKGGREELLRGVDEGVLDVAMFLLSPLLLVRWVLTTTTTILSLLLSHHRQTPSLESIQKPRGKLSMYAIVYAAGFTSFPEEDLSFHQSLLPCDRRIYSQKPLFILRRCRRMVA